MGTLTFLKSIFKTAETEPLDDAEIIRRYHEILAAQSSNASQYWALAQYKALATLSKRERARLTILFEEGLYQAICNRYDCDRESVQPLMQLFDESRMDAAPMPMEFNADGTVVTDGLWEIVDDLAASVGLTPRE